MSALSNPVVYEKELRTRYINALRAKNINVPDSGTVGELKLLASAHGVKFSGGARGPNKKKRSYADRSAMPSFGIVTSSVPLPRPKVKNNHNPVLLLPEIVANLTAGQSVHVTQEYSKRTRLLWKTRIHRHNKRAGIEAKYFVAEDPENPGFIRIWRKA